MDIFELADFIDTEVEIKFMQSWLGNKIVNGNIWLCDLKDCEVKEGPILKSSFGQGKTPQQALNDYCEQISNKKLVKNAYGKEKREEYDLKTITGDLSSLITITRS